MTTGAPPTTIVSSLTISSGYEESLKGVFVPSEDWNKTFIGTTLNVNCKANGKLPSRGSKGAAGYDLFSESKCVIAPLSREVISTGLSLQIPSGFFGKICPRSGLAVKHGIDVLAGIIDEDYRGEIKVVLYNTDNKTPFTVNVGDKIAQIIFQPYCPTTFKRVSELNTTIRGEGGFGSTDEKKVENKC